MASLPEAPIDGVGTVPATDGAAVSDGTGTSDAAVCTRGADVAVPDPAGLLT